MAKPYRPTCQQCGKPARHIGRPELTRAQRRNPAYGPYFCTRRCAAAWALARGGTEESWCGVPFEDAPQADCEGPHGWHRDDACPECEALKSHD